MPTSKNYRAASGAHSAATEYGVDASVQSSRRAASEDIYNIKTRQRSNLFGAISEGLGIGKNLYDIYQSNQESIDYAKDALGLEVTSGPLSNIFGDPEFRNKMTGETFTSEQVGGMKQWGKFYESGDAMKNLIAQKRLMDTSFKGPNDPSRASAMRTKEADRIIKKYSKENR